ncbi:MAG TPA: PstS family phosphate ABC transporter substrate-binding protein [Kofleriaceae bacterium]|nr:PstS family phosphate ABC transporter substrate-binding protein [Kofleriaceae bacterium]
MKILLIAAVCSLLACKGGDKGESGKTTEPIGGGAAGETGGQKVSGAVIQIDGSSTVFPINQAVAEEFQKDKGGKVTVGVSGTGGGFKKFCRGEIAIAGASRPIKDEEAAACKSGGIDFVELPVAYDGLAIVVHKNNKWVDHVTVDELKTMWAPEAQDKVKKWSQVRKGWPDKDLHLFGPGVDSGTYDYFTQAVVGKEHSSRGDFTSSEDDNVLVQGVSSDEAALGFFGYAYYAENQDKLKLVPVDDKKDDNGKGPVAPSPETVEKGTYQPLSRPIFIYVSTRAMERPEVKAFVDYYLTKGPELVKEVGYIALPARAYELAQKRFADRKTGSVFHGSKVGVTVEELLAR